MIYTFKENRVFRSYFGGKRLDRLSGKATCADSQFPEEWIASTVRAFNAGREDIVEGPSVCENGELLKDIIEKDPKAFLGKEPYDTHGSSMSILVKLLDAAERLFIQCHPTIPFAKEFFHSDFGKTECWYILSAEEDAHVYIGFKPEITREKWQACFDRQDVDGMLALMHKIRVKAGDLVFVDGGVPHAIGGGCLLCELQEPTDYMVIPERASKSGIVLTDKKMHGGLGFDKMMDCFVFRGLTEEELRKRYVRHPEPKDNVLVPVVDASLTDKFKMDCLKITGTAAPDFGDTYAVGVITAGACVLVSGGERLSLSAGKSFIVSAGNGPVHMTGNATVMFCRP